MAKKQPNTKRKTAKPRRADAADRIVAWVKELDIDYRGTPVFIDGLTSRIRRAINAASRAKPSPKAKPKAVADEPRVTGPHETGGWDIRTKTHWFADASNRWVWRDQETDDGGYYSTEAEAKRALPAARKAWAEMKNGGAK